MNLNINSITAKLASKAELLGKLYGYVAPMAMTKPDDPFGGVITQHKQAFDALMKGKFPKPDVVFSQITRGEFGRPVFMNGLIAYIIGEVAGGFIGSKNANALKKFGTEAMKYSALSSAVIVTGWNPHKPAGLGSSGSPSGNSPSWGYQT